MKSKRHLVLAILIILLIIPSLAYSNMAAPEYSDIGSSITFEKNNEILVKREILDITVKGNKADIVATYTMKNTLNVEVETKAMFLTPNFEERAVKVIANSIEKTYIAKSYILNYETKIDSVDWKYAVLTNEELEGRDPNQTIDTISFSLEFKPQEEYDVVVNYQYKLGGYPDSDFDAKRGEIEYYLAPAAMWKGFESLTINLSLDKDMPIIKQSNLDFKKVGSRKYEYTSEKLPEENLKIVIDENWYQNIWSTLRSPYLSLMLVAISPFVILVLVIVGIIIWRARRKRKNNS